MNQAGHKGNNFISRRGFLKLFAPVRADHQESAPVPAQESPASQRFQLEAIRNLPEPVLRQMVPVLRRDLSVTIHAPTVAFRTAKGGEEVVMLSHAGCEAVKLFDGHRSLEQVGAEMDLTLEGEPGGGFAVARQTFLTLSSFGAYHPAGPPVAAQTVTSQPAADKTTLPGPGKSAFLFLVLITLTAVLIERGMHAECPPHDRGWFRGIAPTVFDWR